MVLQRDLMTKAMRKGRATAVSLLNRLAKTAGLPEPVYDHQPGASKRKPSHFMKVTFRVPGFLQEMSDCSFEYHNVVGGGRASQKAFAKSLAALEAVQRLEETLGLGRGELLKVIDKYEEDQQKKKEEIQATPVEQEIEGVSWDSFPIDHSFPDSDPATRRGRIHFNRELRENIHAFSAAKAVTLSTPGMLPEVVIHGTRTDYGFKQYANIKMGGKTVAGGSSGSDVYINLRRKDAEILTLEDMGAKCFDGYPPFITDPESSFGMAKVLAKLPAHHLDDITELMDSLTSYEESVSRRAPDERFKRSSRGNPTHLTFIEDESKLQKRISLFRKHQKDLSLPVDSIEDDIPHDAPVTVVRGGTGSGKTTRYPLMLSLFSPVGPSTNVVVAQPRRLACQTAARRVAFEQDSALGKDGCPIGYNIRFESFPPKARSRTVNFNTPGVILRRAMSDPLLQDVTHLVIDEVHERNADMDLLLSLAKNVQKQRANHPTLPPLRVVLMSATLDSDVWDSYFHDESSPVAIVDVPNVRRFPIDIVHLGSNAFPLNKMARKELIGSRKRNNDILWDAAAQLAVEIFQNSRIADGSILCFLPGIEEIRRVQRKIYKSIPRGGEAPKVVMLHSSLSAKDQAKAFQPGPKIILSTNIAETSVTIPDVKIVIDTGKERQHSLLESRSDDISVVGSQLTTVDISKASAKQRAGRAGRVSAGICYRLYTTSDHDAFDEFTEPEMLRMDVTSLVLHSLSVYHPVNGHSLQVLQNTPDPPTASRLSQSLRTLENTGLIYRDENDHENVSLTPLGGVVSNLPTSPRIARMLVLGLAVGAIEPALDIAALLSVPKAFSVASHTQLFRHDEFEDPTHSSDIVKLMEMYRDFQSLDSKQENIHPVKIEFRQVARIRNQLERAIKDFLKGKEATNDLAEWNKNCDRLAAVASLICTVTPHIAHLASGKMDFATRDVPGYARIHPSSVNAGPQRRTHWYLYDQLRTTSAPFLHLTTAVSPLELALFAEASNPEKEDIDYDFDAGYGRVRWLFLADQWIPVQLSASRQKETFLQLRELLTNDLLQQLANDPESVRKDSTYHRIILYVLAAIEQQRIKS